MRFALDLYLVMARKKSNANRKSAWALVARQHGIVTRDDLLGIGFSPAAIEHRIAKGRLRRIGQGVYTVSRPKVSREGRWMAAILPCGEGAVLSHRSAAALWGIAPEGPEIDVSVRRRCLHRRRSIHMRSRTSLPAEDVTKVDGIPVTTPARTLLDLATVLSVSALERAINEADKRDRIDPETLRAKLADFVGEPGVVKLRTLLDRETFRLSDSRLERLFRPIAADVGLPVPETKVEVNGFEVDFYWPDLGLVIETDGLRYHRTPFAQGRDHFRDQMHTAAGLTRLRFTHHQIKYKRAHVIRILRATVQNLN